MAIISETSALENNPTASIEIPAGPDTRATSPWSPSLASNGSFSKIVSAWLRISSMPVFITSVSAPLAKKNGSTHVVPSSEACCLSAGSGICSSGSTSSIPSNGLAVKYDVSSCKRV
ncbi:hypothetical protein D3C74_252770 [compost metagenome]